MSLELNYEIVFRLRKGKVVTKMGNKNLMKCMKEEKIKPSQCTQDCSAIKSRFDEIKNELSIKTLIECLSKEIKKKEHFEHNRGGF